MQKGISLKQRLVKATVGSFGLKIASTGLTFLLNLLLARTMGSEGLGTYALAISWIGLLGLPAKLGFPHLLVRDVAVYLAQSNWGNMKGLLIHSYQVSVVFSILLPIALAPFVWLIADDTQTLLTMLLALSVLPLTSVRILTSSAMSGLHKVVEGQVPVSLIAPLGMVVLILFNRFVLFNDITPALAVSFYVGVAAVTVLIGLCQLKQALPNGIETVSPIFVTTGALIRQSLPFMLMGALYLIHSQTDIVMLGALKGPESVGLYVVPYKLASLVGFILLASNTALKPSISELCAMGNTSRLQNIIAKSSKTVLLAAFLLSAAIFFAKDYLLVLFGKDFLGTDGILIILIASHLFSAFFGPADLLLTMSNHEKSALIIFVISGVSNIIFNITLIPTYGSYGAATATAMSVVIWNLLSAAWVMKCIRINPTALSRPKT